MSSRIHTIHRGVSSQCLLRQVARHHRRAFFVPSTGCVRQDLRIGQLHAAAFSTSSPRATQPQAAPSSVQDLPPPPPPPRRRSRLRWYIISGTFLLFGFGLGLQAREALGLRPPVLPEPGSPLDVAATAQVRRAAAQLPVVKALEVDPAWTTVDAPDAADSNSGNDDARNAHQLTSTTGPLAGVRGIGAYRAVFANPSTAQVVAVVYIGSATVGWPGVAHGGLLAALLDETCGRAAALRLADAGAGGQDSASAAGPDDVTARSLTLAYRKPTFAGNFIVMRATAGVPQGAVTKARWGGRGGGGGGDGRTVSVSATLEDGHGRVCIEADGLYAAAK